jgi:hypothetical protein
VRRRDQLIARLKVERAEDRVDALGGIRNEAEVVRPHAEEVSHGTLGLADQRVTPPGEQFHRLGLDPAAPFRLLVQHAPRHGAEGPVVEEGDVLPQRPLLAK